MCGLSLDRCRLSPPFLRTFVNLSCPPEPFLHPAPCRPPSPPAPPDPSLITLSLSFCLLPTSSCPFLGNVTFEKPVARQDDSSQSCTHLIWPIPGGEVFSQNAPTLLVGLPQSVQIHSQNQSLLWQCSLLTRRLGKSGL